MNQTINILLLGGSKRVSVAEFFKDAGNKLSKNISIFSYELNAFEPIATIGEIIIGLKWNDALLEQDLMRVIQYYQINIVVPFVDIATLVCGKLKPEFPSVHFAVSNLAISSIMFDKSISNQWFIDKGYRVPSNEVKLPIVAKPIKGSGGKGMFFINSAEQLLFFQNSEIVEDYIIQKLINGLEYSVDCYVNKMGDVISIVPRRRLEITNGEATKSITERNERIIKLSRKILLDGKFTGPITIQFIIEEGTNVIFLLEINPRLGSGVLTSIQAGANICEYIINDFLNIRTEEKNDWEISLLMVRAFKEYYFYANHN